MQAPGLQVPGGDHARTPQRSTALVVLLHVVTLGLYRYVWLHQANKEGAQAVQRKDTSVPMTSWMVGLLVVALLVTVLALMPFVRALYLDIAYDDQRGWRDIEHEANHNTEAFIARFVLGGLVVVAALTASWILSLIVLHRIAKDNEVLRHAAGRTKSLSPAAFPILIPVLGVFINVGGMVTFLLWTVALGMLQSQRNELHTGRLERAAPAQTA